MLRLFQCVFVCVSLFLLTFIFLLIPGSVQSAPIAEDYPDGVCALPMAGNAAEGRFAVLSPVG